MNTLHRLVLTLCVITVADYAMPNRALAVPWQIESGLLPRSAPADSVPESPTGLEHPNVTWKDLQLGLAADAFLTYQLTASQGVLNSEFDLSRVQITAFTSYKHLAGLNVTLESIRSSGPNSYYGVDQDSLLPRFKWAFAEATPLTRWISIRAGIIPDILLPYAEASWDFRMQGATGLERDSMFPTGDLGLSIEAALPFGLGSLALSYTNGESIHLREQNNGKDTSIALRLAPARDRLPGLLIHLLYRDGSVGPASAADSRLAGGVTYTGHKLGFGALATWAMGYLGIGDRDALHSSFWLRGELPYHAFLFGRVDLLVPDARDLDSRQTRLIAGAAYALPALLRVALSYEGTLPAGTLSAEVPAVLSHSFLVQVEGRL